MASTPTTRNRFAKQGIGDNAGTWGTVMNDQALDLIDEAADGVQAVAVAANVTLTSTNYVSDQARKRVLRFTGAGGFTVTIPGVEKFYVIHNACTAAVTVKTAGGVSVSIAASAITFVYCDGTDCYAATNTGSSTFTTALTVTSASASAIAAGANGATNPVLQVDASAASVATGIKITGSAAAGGVNIAAISSGANEETWLNGKGSGAVRIGNLSTGNIIIGTGALVLTSAGAISGATSGSFSSTLNVTGDTGIGVAAGSYKLEVSDLTAGRTVSRFQGSYATSGNVIISEWARNGGAISAAVRYKDASGSMEFYSPTGHTVAYTTTSDERLKTDLRPVNAGPLIDALEVFDFAWRYRAGRGISVLAQRAAAVFPAAITAGDADPNKAPGMAGFEPWGVDNPAFVPLLLAEVKALRARVAALEAR